MMADQSYGELRAEGAAVLQAAGIEDAHIDARILLSHASGLSRAQLIVFAKDKVPARVAETFQICLARRKTHEPLAYIVGEKPFWSLTFKVNQHVLIPRPETEAVVEQALEVLQNRQAAKIIDVGTGTGAILISLLHELADARGCGVDISKPALALAKHNALQAGVADRCTFEISNYLQTVRGRFDIVVANPPYITEAAMATLPKTVGKFEPYLALRGGVDGLDAYRKIIAHLPGVLKPGGQVVFEIGYDQKQLVSTLLATAGATNIICRQDLAGHDRVISATIC